MNLLRFFTAALAAVPLLAPAASVGNPAVVTTPQVRAELVAHAPEGVEPGKPMWLGLKIEHQPHWHTYWKNPGDSGLPTTMEWTLPADLKAGAIEWPTPSKLPIGPLLNYGYEGTLLLPVAVTVPAGFNADSVEVKLYAEWLVCKDVCIPESGEFTLKLPAKAATAGHGALFEAARAALPVAAAGARASADIRPDAIELRISGLPVAWQGKPIAFFPETAGVIQTAAKVEGQWKGDTWSARVPLDPQRSASPQTMPAVLTTPGEKAGLQLDVAVNGTWPTIGNRSSADSRHAVRPRSADDEVPGGARRACRCRCLDRAQPAGPPCGPGAGRGAARGHRQHADRLRL